MTVNDDDVGHFNENCFAEEVTEDLAKSDAKPESVVSEEVKVEPAVNLDDGTSSRASGEISLEEWQEINNDEFSLIGVRPPDFMTDPFKEKWSQVKC